MALFSPEELQRLGTRLAVADFTNRDFDRFMEAEPGIMKRIRSLIRHKDSADIVSAILENRVNFYFDGRQREGTITGREIFSGLSTSGLISKCVDWYQLEDFQMKINRDQMKPFWPGIENCFAGTRIFGWRGVCGDLAPFLHLDSNAGQFLLGYENIGNNFGANSPALIIAP